MIDLDTPVDTLEHVASVVCTKIPLSRAARENAHRARDCYRFEQNNCGQVSICILCLCVGIRLRTRGNGRAAAKSL